MTTAYIELRKNREGSDRAYIADTRVRVQDVYALAEIHGRTPDEIAAALPSLRLAQIHAALAYYFDHREEILQEMRDDDAFVRDFRAHSASGTIDERLKAAGQPSDPVSS